MLLCYDYTLKPSLVNGKVPQHFEMHLLHILRRENIKNGQF